MEQLIIGFMCGAFMAIFMLVAGYTAGKRAEKQSRVDPPSVAAEERKRVKEAHEAFQTMMNYSADVAYQMSPDLNGPGGEVLK